MSVADDRWDRAEEHYDESIELIRLINELDEDSDSLDLRLGGDGDAGEVLAYFLDELIASGKIEITIN